MPCETQAPITTLNDAGQLSLQPVAGSSGGVLGNLLKNLGITKLLPAKDSGRTARLDHRRRQHDRCRGDDHRRDDDRRVADPRCGELDRHDEHRAPMKRAIRTHLTDFAAILGLLVLSVVVAGYILHQERLRFPFVQSSPMKMYAQMSTAQAFTPGQGQSVRISGVQVGEIGAVSLQNGVAKIEMDIESKYGHIVHTDASVFARPRTGLQDVFLELNPGTKSAPLAKGGFTIPVTNALPEVNVDEILSALDGDTRAYLNLLVNGAGQGLKGRGGSELSQVFKRFLPTHRDLARLNRAVAVRGTNLQRLVNSLQRLNTALATKQGQIVQLVDASATVFRAFASENGNISRAVADLPGTLQQTTATLAKVQTFANLLGPTATSLLPAARALPAANQALTALARPSAPIIQNQIRPFVIAARPLVRNLRPAAINLAKATPNLTGVFVVLNHLFNDLGYNPSKSIPGQHGYLWWLAWLDHNARTLFSVQDAASVFRPLFVQISCAQLQNLLTAAPIAVPVLNFSPVKSICNTLGLGSAAKDHGHQGRCRRHPGVAVPDGGEALMETGTPSLRRVITMALFALSCVGLLMFLWLSFGGTIPLNAQGYRIQVSFPNAGQLGTQADVRISGVTSARSSRSRSTPTATEPLATLQIDSKFAPIHRDAHAILRQKTIIGETYVELSPGTPHSPTLRDGGLLPRGQVQNAVQLADVFNTFDTRTRRSFQGWQQELATALAGNDQNLNNVLGNLPTFAADASDILRVLDIEHGSVVRLLQNGGTTFAALGQNQSALRNLITSAEATFATTAANNAALAQTFHVFPTFLTESRLTFARLQSFAISTDPVIRALNPAIQQLGPTLQSVSALSPDLRNLFTNLGPLIDASKTGLPAVRDVINGATPVLGALGPFLEQLNPILHWLSLHQQLISDFISQGAAGISGLTNTTTYGGGGGLTCRRRAVRALPAAVLAAGQPGRPDPGPEPARQRPTRRRCGWPTPGTSAPAASSPAASRSRPGIARTPAARTRRPAAFRPAGSAARPDRSAARSPRSRPLATRASSARALRRRRRRSAARPRRPATGLRDRSARPRSGERHPRARARWCPRQGRARRSTRPACR